MKLKLSEIAKTFLFVNLRRIFTVIATYLATKHIIAEDSLSAEAVSYLALVLALYLLDVVPSVATRVYSGIKAKYRFLEALKAAPGEHAEVVKMEADRKLQDEHPIAKLIPSSTKPFIFLLALIFASCGYSILEGARDVDDAAQVLAPIVKQKNPDKSAEIDAFAQTATDLRVSVEANNGNTLAILADLVRSFQTNIRPLIGEESSVKGALFDLALRKLVRKLQDEAAKNPQIAKSTVSDMRAKGMPVDEDLKTINDYLNSPKLEK
ncbi:MAG TPA: hypothetical protein VJS44_08290 [Pyrinomonadaceae bacterium]|nr:hypothetical protein [Pyrinomonadaceae bacterium]